MYTDTNIKKLFLYLNYENSYTDEITIQYNV